jgi:hypothetical protein
MLRYSMIRAIAILFLSIRSNSKNWVPYQTCIYGVFMYCVLLYLQALFLFVCQIIILFRPAFYSYLYPSRFRT